MKLTDLSHGTTRIGLGCMNLSHAYGVPPSEEDGIALLNKAFDLGVRHFDTAALYGFGRNEELVGKALSGKRDQIFLASKCGMTGVDGKRVIDGSPETITKTLELALQRLQTDFIDLYYLHRWDKNVPIEDSMGALAKMVEQGKIGAIGLSEVSADTLQKAQKVHPIAAVQTEYSLWTRNAELAVLDTCEQFNIAFVAFSPLARGFLTATINSPGELTQGDIRCNMPRFQEPNFSKNVLWLQRVQEIAESLGVTPGQLSLAWLLKKKPYIYPIPGTRSISHLEENMAAADLSISDEVVNALDDLVNQSTVSGTRYPPATQAEIDTEEFV